MVAVLGGGGSVVEEDARAVVLLYLDDGSWAGVRHLNISSSSSLRLPLSRRNLGTKVLYIFFWNVLVVPKTMKARRLGDTPDR